MLNISRVANFQGKERSLFFNLFGSFSLLLIFFASALAQSDSDLAATYKWLNSKAQDPGAKAALRSISSASCGPQKGAGAYDPLPCIDKQKKEWAAMLEIARGDAATSATVINTIQKIVTELSARADRWNALSPAEKNRQIAIQTEIMQWVQKSGNNMQRGLQTIINDPSRSQATRDAARTMLLVPKGGGPRKCNPNCACVYFPSCTCCTGFPWPSTIITAW